MSQRILHNLSSLHDFSNEVQWREIPSFSQEILKNNYLFKSVFILTFLLAYTILTLSYKLFLEYSSGAKFYPDYMTNLVAEQSKALLYSLDYRVDILPHPDEPSIKLIINEKKLPNGILAKYP